MIIEIENTKESKIAMILTVVFHALVALLLLWLTLISPDPPLELKSIPVSLRAMGDSHSGSGQSQAVPDALPVPNTAIPKPQSTSASTPQNSPTQDTSPVQTTDAEPKDEPAEETKPEQEVDAALNEALGWLDKGTDNSSGHSETGGHEGTNDGNIAGKGLMGDDKAFGYNLIGFEMAASPSLDESPTKSGIVVFDIYVRKDGSIKDMKRNYSLSNTSSDYLFKLGEKALNSVEFKANADGSAINVGTFTFNFKLK
ncbi:MAG: hypothetical protein ACI84C_000242 [Flavobacteriales bacterium]|jgi:hypothetical protein